MDFERFEPGFHSLVITVSTQGPDAVAVTTNVTFFVPAPPIGMNIVHV